MLLIALLVGIGIYNFGLPQPQAARDLGVTGEENEEPEGRGEGEEGEEDQKRRRRPPPRVAPDGEPVRPEGMSADEAQGQGQGEGRNTDEMPFRNEYSSAGGQAPVAVVLFHDDYEAPTGVYYFRQSAFSQYNGMRLVQTAAYGLDTDVVELFPVSRMQVPGAPPAGSGRREMSTTVGLIAEHQKPFGLDSPATFWPIENPDPLRFKRAYRTVSRVPTTPYRELLGRRSGLPGWTDADRAHYTASPTHDPRYAVLAHEIRASLPEEHREDPLALAFAVKLWLEENGTYSRRSGHAEADDPTAHFLFGDRIGYCVHFAHASAFLLRTLGVPARVAGGYAVDEARRGGGSSLLVRGLDAHAWPEVAIEGIGWVVVDIAPRRTLDEQAEEPDQTLQQMLGESLRNGPQDPTVEEPPRPWPSLAAFARAGAALLAVATLLALLVKLYRAAAPRIVSARHVHRVAYRAALDRLSEVGLRRERGETRESFARRALGVSPAFVPLTQQHLAWAHGSRQPLDAAAARELCRLVAHEARRRVPRWRWLFGLLNPVSYLGSR